MVTLHPLFSPDMVLQSGSPVRFHGTASPEERFKAFFAGESRVIQADASGLWMAEFSPLEKGYTQYRLVLKYENGTEICHIDGIVAGEVWLCAGQSNMAMPVYSDNPYFRLSDREYEQVFTEADTVDLRFFNAAERSLDYDLLSDGKDPGGFVVLDDPERLIRVPAKIENNGVTVFIPPDTHPVELRYCYAAYDAAANLCSRDGLPVLPFRRRFR